MSLFRRLRDLFASAAESIITSEEDEAGPPCAERLSAPRARPFLRQLVKDYRRQSFRGRIFGGQFNPSEHEVGSAILELAPELQVECAVEISARVAGSGGVFAISSPEGPMKALLGRLYRRKLPFKTADFEAILESLERGFRFRNFNHGDYPLTGLLGRVEAAYEDHPIPDELDPHLKWLRDKLCQPNHPYSEDLRVVNRIENLLRYRAFDVGESDEETAPAAVDAWTSRLSEIFGSQPPDQRRKWYRPLAHWNQASSSSPSRKFRNEAASMIREIGEDDFQNLALEVLAAVGKTGPDEVTKSVIFEHVEDRSLVHDRYADHLRGLIWYCVEVPSNELISRLAEVAERCYRKIPNLGPRCPKIANACVVALGEIALPEAIGQLTRLKNSVGYVSARKQVERAIERAGKVKGLSISELEELAVPTLGLAGPGRYEVPVGADYTARITFAGPEEVAIRWENADGKSRTSVPKVLTSEEGTAAEVKRLRALVREIKSQLTGQEKRIESLLLFDPSWSFEDWNTRYLDHPLLAVLVRRLLWSVTSDDEHVTVCPLEGRLLDVDGHQIDTPQSADRVRLWHPVEADEAEIEAWRGFFDRHGVTQPFQQVLRDRYRLDGIEPSGESLGERFAGHRIRQAKFVALCRQRRWQYQVMGEWDSANTPTLSLPEHGLTVEFDVDPAPERSSSEYGVHLQLITGGWRVCRSPGEGAVRLETVPARVVSEVMRDLNLFVSVCGIADESD